MVSGIHEIVFKSGRYHFARRGVFGVYEDPKTGKFVLTDGYDDPLKWPYGDLDVPEPNDLEVEDIKEIAEMMIDRWQRFINTLST